MHRLTRLLILATFAVTWLGCSEPEQFAETTAALTQSPCSAFHPPMTVDVSTATSCTRYWLPAGSIYAPYYVQPADGTPITSVFTGQNAAAWVCDALNPIGLTQSPWAPCWNGGVRGDNHVRVRGSGGPEVGQPYAASSAFITSIVGRSAVLSLGHLAGPPACPYTQVSPPNTPGHAHSCNRYSDDGQETWTENYDPTDSTSCCQASGSWPDGASGAPCSAHADGVGGDGQYATIVYGC